MYRSVHFPSYKQTFVFFSVAGFYYLAIILLHRLVGFNSFSFRLLSIDVQFTLGLLPLFALSRLSNVWWTYSYYTCMHWKVVSMEWNIYIYVVEHGCSIHERASNVKLCIVKVLEFFSTIVAVFFCIISVPKRLSDWRTMRAASNAFYCTVSFFF